MHVHHGSKHAGAHRQAPRCEIVHDGVEKRLRNRSWRSIRPTRAASLFSFPLEGELADYNHGSVAVRHGFFTVKHTQLRNFTGHGLGIFFSIVVSNTHKCEDSSRIWSLECSDDFSFHFDMRSGNASKYGLHWASSLQKTGCLNDFHQVRRQHYAVSDEVNNRGDTVCGNRRCIKALRRGVKLYDILKIQTLGV
ncbi:Uncharacterised protein [Corynebacterium renale]|nr:Uncharacterised protein [Corynebacterium renale]